MSGQADLARGWLRKADSDLEAARAIIETGKSLDAACFHAQQAAEKALKAILAFKSAPISPAYTTWTAYINCV